MIKSKAEEKSISLLTKLISFRYYLTEVPINGKGTHPFFRKILRFDIYASQIIRTGSCITLLSNPMSMTTKSFFSIALFEDYVKFIYWTYNESFLFLLKEQIANLTLSQTNHFHSVLIKYLEPYSDDLNGIDEELSFCLVKEKL